MMDEELLWIFLGMALGHALVWGGAYLLGWL